MPWSIWARQCGIRPCPQNVPARVRAVDVSRLTHCTCQFSASRVLSSAGEELFWEGQEEGRGHKRKRQERPGHEKREREGSMRRGMGAHSQPPQEHLLSITPGPRQCDSVAILWAPPPTALPSTAAAHYSCPDPTAGKGTSCSTPLITLCGLLPSLLIQLPEEEPELFCIHPCYQRLCPCGQCSLLLLSETTGNFSGGQCSRRAHSQLHYCLSAATEHATLS